MLVFGGSSRTHTLRIHQRDALQLLEAQHAALTAQLAALEKEVADPAPQHDRSVPELTAARAAHPAAPEAHLLPELTPLARGCPLFPGRLALAAWVLNRGRGVALVPAQDR